MGQLYFYIIIHLPYSICMPFILHILPTPPISLKQFYFEPKRHKITCKSDSIIISNVSWQKALKLGVSVFFWLVGEEICKKKRP